MKAQDARNARRPEKTFIATNSDMVSRENRNPLATHAKPSSKRGSTRKLTTVIEASTPHHRPRAACRARSSSVPSVLNPTHEAAVWRQGEKRG